MKFTMKRNFQLQLETLEDRLALSGVALGQDIIQADAIFSENDQRMHLIGVARNDVTGHPVANEVIQIGDYDNAPSVTDDALGAIYADLSKGALLGQVTTDALGHFDKPFVWSGTINLLFRLPGDVWADLVMQATSTVPVQVAPPAPEQPQPAPGVDPAPAVVDGGLIQHQQTDQALTDRINQAVAALDATGTVLAGWLVPSLSPTDPSPERKAELDQLATWDQQWNFVRGQDARRTILTNQFVQAQENYNGSLIYGGGALIISNWMTCNDLIDQINRLDGETHYVEAKMPKPR